jgi:hypothetical protein
MSDKIFLYFLICINIFFVSGETFNKSSVQNSLEEKKIESFLHELLLKEGGCFTLLGDKPMTSMLIYESNALDFDITRLSTKTLQEVQYIDSETALNYQEWKKWNETQEYKNFFFVSLPLENDPTGQMLFFVNIQETKKMMHTFRGIVKKITGCENEDRLLEELKKPDVKLWRLILKDHFLAGMLYGYGEENSKMFTVQKKRFFTNKNFRGKVTRDNFPIPHFAIAKDDKTSKKYKKQRGKIKQTIKNRSLTQVIQDSLN